MSKTPKPEDTEKDPEQDLADFERLPEDKKNLMKLKDQKEKSTGPEEAEIHEDIEEIAEKSKP